MSNDDLDKWLTLEQRLQATSYLDREIQDLRNRTALHYLRLGREELARLVMRSVNEDERTKYVVAAGLVSKALGELE